MRTLFYLFCVLLILNCTKEGATKIEVDPEFQPFVDSFVAEAAKRGVDINFEETGLSLTFGEVPANANGVCTGLREGMSSTHEIIIDRNRWKGDNEFEKERLIYHELGHCFLGRPHLNTTNTNGTCVSMMNSGESGCVNAYGRLTRARYLDELFGNN